MNAQRVIGVISLLAIGGLIGGCASVQVQPVSVAQVNDPAIEGIRFFQPQPYLWVTQMPARPAPAMHLAGWPGMGRPMRPGQGPMRPPGGRWYNSHGGMSMRGMGEPAGSKDQNPANGMPRHADHRQHSMHGMMAGHGRHGPTHQGPRMTGPRPPMPIGAGRMRPNGPPQSIYELQIIYLPDYSHPYVANIHGGLGHSPNSLILANGWQLLAVNVKGKVTPAKPIRALTAIPAMPPQPPGMMRHPIPGMMGTMGMALRRQGPGKHGSQHMLPNRNQNHGWRQHHRMMPRRMFMPGRAAMAMGLRPGLYAFVFNAKTGKLEGLRMVRMLKEHPGHKHKRRIKWKPDNRPSHPESPESGTAANSAK